MTDTPARGRAALDDLFARLGIVPRTIEHPPVHTVEDAMPYWAGLAGMHTKNLFLKDRKGALWLIVLPAERRADLKALARLLDAKTFSFGSAELLDEVLGIRPGGVSPLALVNDPAGRVTLVLDAALTRGEAVTFHPLTNEATTELKTADFLRFLKALGRKPRVIEVGEA